MPLVSVIMAVRNPGAHIEEAIGSLASQTFSDFELIIIDDGSTEEIKSDICQNIPRARIIRQPQRGVSAARNAALLECSGKYFAILDCDDVWKPTKLAAQVAVMEDDAEVGLCYTGHEVIEIDGSIRGGALSNEVDDTAVIVDIRSDPSRTSKAMKAIVQPGICTSSVLCRKDVLPETGLFDPLLSYSEDIDMWIKIHLYFKVARVPSVLTQYRVHSNNASLNYQKALEQCTTMVNRYSSSAPARGENNIKEGASVLLSAARKGIRAGLYATA